jgi:hypothetical protein
MSLTQQVPLANSATPKGPDVSEVSTIESDSERDTVVHVEMDSEGQPLGLAEVGAYLEGLGLRVLDVDSGLGALRVSGSAGPMRTL